MLEHITVELAIRIKNNLHVPSSFISHVMVLLVGKNSARASSQCLDEGRGKSPYF